MQNSTEYVVTPDKLLNRGLSCVALAQFFSALADNALLFAILALAARLNYSDWVDPVFQLLFVGVYVITAPFVGSFADRFDKGKVMLLSNCLKLSGALLVLLGGNPFLGYVIVGLGASLYSPAKYGILSEVAHANNLIKANGIIEASTILAILIGAILGGILADYDITVALGFCAFLYFLASLINLFFPKLAPQLPPYSLNPIALTRSFFESFGILLKDFDGKLSLIGTSLFWGAGITLRFLLLAWVPYVLTLTDKTTPSILNAVVAVGIIIGSGLAAKFITLERAKLALLAGILMGVGVIFAMLMPVSPPYQLESQIIDTSFSAIHKSLAHIHIVLIVIGIFGGFFIVPLNALLQARGKALIGVGKAIAIQNFAENSAMLVMLSIYTLFSRQGLNPIYIGIGFGAIFSLMLVFITIKSRPLRHKI